MFIDIAKIKIVSGKGGDGKVGFHREKYVAAGGPDGGDGGRGGSVIFKVDDNLSTLLDFRYKKKYVAAPGEPGGGKRCKGKDGADLIIRVPRGTIIRDQKTGQVMKDMSDSEPFVAAKGGNGGWGNTHFATPTRQAPRFAKPGLPGVERDIILELKLLADVGLVGFPNVGKSTLLSMVSAARPKIANYHFTTLVPNLGVVSVGEEQNFVMADIPGIIEGASEGAGLGHDFLRHIDRCRLLLHLVDAAGSEGRDPIDDIEKINAELAGYSEFLAARPQIIVANKTDLLGDDREPVEKIRKYAEERGFLFAELSAATNQGVKELMNLTWHELQQLPPVFIYEPEFVEVEEKAATENDWTIERDGDDRVCSYPAATSLFDLTETPSHTGVCLLVDKEEIGSDGVTGMQSRAFDTFMADLCRAQDVLLDECFENSVCLSADVCNAFDPNYPEVSEKRNDARANCGFALVKYTGARGKSGTSDATAELMARIRCIFDKAGVIWQTGQLGKVDQGGGGTVAMYLANRNIDTVDAGVPVLSMHAPFECIAKLDLYMAYKGFGAFYRD